jgi:hypothetical protein
MCFMGATRVRRSMPAYVTRNSGCDRSVRRVSRRRYPPPRYPRVGGLRSANPPYVLHLVTADRTCGGGSRYHATRKEGLCWRNIRQVYAERHRQGSHCNRKSCVV